MWNGNLKTAVTSLRTTKWRSLLTMLGIIIGVSSVVTVVSLGEGFKQQVVGQIHHLGSDVLTIRSGKLIAQSDRGQAGLNVLAFLSPSTLTNKDVDVLTRLPTLKSVVPFAFVSNSASTGGRQIDNLYVVGTTGNMAEVLNQKLAYGEFLNGTNGNQDFAVIGTDIADNLFGEYNPVGRSATIGDQEFIVRGVLKRTEGGLLAVAQTDFNSAIFIPYSAAQQLSNGRPNLLQIMAKARDPAQVDTAVADIQRALEDSHGSSDFTVLKQYQLLGLAGGVVNTAAGFISAIAAISLLVGGIGIMDIMLVSVSERTREIGIRKAVGATNRQIRNQFLTEGLVLTMAGGIVGIATAFVINFILRLYTGWEPIITWSIVLAAVGVSVVVGIIFSTAPAVKAARKDPIDALRS